MVMEKTDQMNLDWGDIRKYMNQAIDQIPDRTKFRRIIGIARGGLPCAALACHILGINDVVSVQVKTYNDHRRKVPRMDHHILPDTPIRGYTGSDTLIVDDISDTGETIGMIRGLYPKASILAATVTGKGIDVVDYYGLVIPRNTWIVFPWECDVIEQQ